MRQRTALGWSGRADGDDEPVDVPRYLAALKRAWPLILLLIVLMTLTVLVLSLALPKSYEASARIVFDDRAGAGALETTDVETVRRQLATVQVLLTTRDVLQQVAQRVPDESADTLEDKVETSVDEDANIIDVTATDGDGAGAAAIANAVARQFLEMEAAADKARFARSREALQTALARLGDSPARRAEAEALRTQLNDLNLSEAANGDRLRLAQSAEPPSSPASPRPVRNTIFAFFASAFIAVLAALAIDQIAPRLSSTRELSRLTGAPVPGRGGLPGPSGRGAPAPTRPQGPTRDERVPESRQVQSVSSVCPLTRALRVSNAPGLGRPSQPSDRGALGGTRRAGPGGRGERDRGW
jgi:capsular polysaccharide biosynthesis protein